MPPGPPLTLIVATTPALGIGRANQLPWPPLRSEMAYFARITRRTAASPSSSASSAPLAAAAATTPQPVNAVIMGRRTWESIPARFRPLAGRLNVVVSRQLQLGPGWWADRPAGKISWKDDVGGDGTGVVGVRSLSEAIATLGQWAASASDGADPAVGERPPWTLHRVFVIGGAEIYAAALQRAEAVRVLRTKVRTEFECDVFFPLALGEAAGWRRADDAALDAWAEEEVPRGVQTEKGVEWEWEMWEREA